MSVVIASLATDVGTVSFSHSAPPGTWPPAMTQWTRGQRFAFATVGGTVVSIAAFHAVHPVRFLARAACVGFPDGSW